MTLVNEGPQPLFPRPEDSSPYENGMDELHQARDVFFAACDAYHGRPSEERQFELAEAAREYSKHFVSTLRDIAEDPALERDRDLLMAGMFAAEDENVVAFYNKLARVNGWTHSTQSIAVTERNIAAHFLEHGDDLDAVLTRLAVSFAKKFAGDASKFVEFSEKLALRKREKRINMIKGTALAAGGAVLAVVLTGWDKFRRG